MSWAAHYVPSKEFSPSASTGEMSLTESSKWHMLMEQVRISESKSSSSYRWRQHLPMAFPCSGVTGDTHPLLATLALFAHLYLVCKAAYSTGHTCPGMLDSSHGVSKKCYTYSLLMLITETTWKLMPESLQTWETECKASAPAGHGAQSWHHFWSNMLHFYSAKQYEKSGVKGVAPRSSKAGTTTGYRQ